MEVTMDTEITFTDHTPETAPDGARAALRATAAQLGFLPSAMARLAESPALVAAFGRLMALWDGCSLDHVAREVVTLTIAHHAACEVCVAMHSAIMTRTVADAALLEALRAQRPLAAPRLEALRLFTRAVLAAHGGVTDAELRSFLDAGFSKQQALDVVLGVGTYTLSTSANRLTRAPVDAPLQPFAWSGAPA
jgi:AhpD family alkylhydroperoxidase